MCAWCGWVGGLWCGGVGVCCCLCLCLCLCCCTHLLRFAAAHLHGELALEQGLGMVKGRHGGRVGGCHGCGCGLWSGWVGKGMRAGKQGRSGGWRTLGILSRGELASLLQRASRAPGFMRHVRCGGSGDECGERRRLACVLWRTRTRRKGRRREKLCFGALFRLPSAWACFLPSSTRTGCDSSSSSLMHATTPRCNHISHLSTSIYNPQSTRQQLLLPAQDETARRRGPRCRTQSSSPPAPASHPDPKRMPSLPLPRTKRRRRRPILPILPILPFLFLFLLFPFLLAAARSSSSTDLYSKLGLQRTATKKEIAKAWRRAAVKTHPDKVAIYTTHPPTHPPTHLFVHPPVYLPTQLSIHPTHPPTHPPRQGAPPKAPRGGEEIQGDLRSIRGAFRSPEKEDL